MASSIQRRIARVRDMVEVYDAAHTAAYNALVNVDTLVARKRSLLAPPSASSLGALLAGSGSGTSVPAGVLAGLDGHVLDRVAGGRALCSARVSEQAELYVKRASKAMSQLLKAGAAIRTALASLVAEAHATIDGPAACAPGFEPVIVALLGVADTAMVLDAQYVTALSHKRWILHRLLPAFLAGPDGNEHTDDQTDGPTDGQPDGQQIESLAAAWAKTNSASVIDSVAAVRLFELAELDLDP